MVDHATSSKNSWPYVFPRRVGVKSRAGARLPFPAVAGLSASRREGKHDYSNKDPLIGRKTCLLKHLQPVLKPTDRLCPNMERGKIYEEDFIRRFPDQCCGQFWGEKLISGDGFCSLQGKNKSMCMMNFTLRIEFKLHLCNSWIAVKCIIIIKYQLPTLLQSCWKKNKQFWRTQKLILHHHLFIFMSFQICMTFSAFCGFWSYFVFHRWKSYKFGTTWGWIMILTKTFF